VEIERINEYTMKFFITYRDIEDRGFDQDEIWHNREKGEELFWEMMDEANEEVEFPVEGPLWIQVQALDKGLEVTVTRAKLSIDGSKIELPVSEDKLIDFPVDEKIESLLDKQFSSNNSEEAPEEEEQLLEFVISFADFEDVLSLAKQVNTKDVENVLYHYNGNYYLHVLFEETMPEYDQDNLLSQMLEYGEEADLTSYLLHEYGKVIIEGNALSELPQHF
jgi:adapter protein MecA 1/2